MIISKTPLRISFFGGGSDIPQYYESEGYGACLSTSINSYIYIAAHRCKAPHLKIIYSKLELANNIEEVQHDIVQNTLKYFDMISNMEICSFSDIPTKGTGLGSSSTYSVGLINALNQVKGNKQLSKQDLAELASYIEIDRCKSPIGKQDQYAAAYGGLNLYEFTKFETKVNKINITKADKINLNRRLLVFNTGINRKAGSVLNEQVEKIKTNTNKNQIRKILEYTEQAVKFLSESRLDDFGALFNESWHQKKQLSSNISNEQIDNMYDTVMKAGALGGKIIGAGGGGYLLAYAPEDKIDSVKSAMKDYELFDYKFEEDGTTLVGI